MCDLFLLTHSTVTYQPQAMRRNQLTVTYPEVDAKHLRYKLLQLKTIRCLHILAFCRAVIAERLE